jgi:hypothetical protein
MKLPRHLQWDPVVERFHNDDEANSMLSRPQRHPYIETWQRLPGDIQRANKIILTLAVIKIGHTKNKSRKVGMFFEVK